MHVTDRALYVAWDPTGYYPAVRSAFDVTSGAPLPWTFSSTLPSQVVAAYENRVLVSINGLDSPSSADVLGGRVDRGSAGVRPAVSPLVRSALCVAGRRHDRSYCTRKPRPRDRRAHRRAAWLASRARSSKSSPARTSSSAAPRPAAHMAPRWLRSACRAPRHRAGSRPRLVRRADDSRGATAPPHREAPTSWKSAPPAAGGGFAPSTWRAANHGHARRTAPTSPASGASRQQGPAWRRARSSSRCPRRQRRSGTGEPDRGVAGRTVRARGPPRVATPPRMWSKLVLVQGLANIAAITTGHLDTAFETPAPPSTYHVPSPR